MKLVAKLVNGGIQALPLSVLRNGMDYESLGYKLLDIVKTPPTCPIGYTYKLTGWAYDSEESPTAIVAVYSTIPYSESNVLGVVRALEGKPVSEMTNSEKSSALQGLIDTIRKVATCIALIPALCFGNVYTTESLGNMTDSDRVVVSVDGLVRTVEMWQGYWGGSNVVFEVTNYYGNTSGEIPKLRIKELIEDGGTNYYKVVWDDSNKFSLFEKSILENLAATNNAIRSWVQDHIANNAAPLAWGTVTDKGTANHATNTVWMTSPSTVFGGGTEFQRVAVGNGTVCVLTRNGSPTYTTGEEGTFRFQDFGGTNYFGFAKTDSYTIGCNTDGIAVDDGMVSLTYNVIMGDGNVPVIYWTPSLQPITPHQLNNSDMSGVDDAPYPVTWLQGDSLIATINVGNNPQGFFWAETSVAGDVVFETNMRTRLDGGIECSNTATRVSGVIRPIYDGVKVEWIWSAK